MAEVKSSQRVLDDNKWIPNLLQKYKQEVEELRKKHQKTNEFISHSSRMRELLELTRRVAPIDSNVLILGESGTGKGVIAKHIHKMSKRNDGPFITISCASIPNDLLELELFGYIPGAFTEVDNTGKIGLVELANGGTLFLDEIAEIPLSLQAKILHIIQENQFVPVGGREIKKVNCRIIASTNRNLNQLVKEGNFREDLYYRLKVIEMQIPPLRERPEDILLLIYFFLNNFDKNYSCEHQFSQESLKKLIQYSWPGNVRELEHLIERLVITVSEQEIKTNHLSKRFNQLPESEDLFSSDSSFDLVMQMVEKELITRTYKELGSPDKVAKKLEISTSKAARLIKKYCNVVILKNVRQLK